MRPIQAYKEHRTRHWTRIEVLLELYAGAISALQQASEALAAGQDLQATRHLVDAQRFVAGIVSGIDPDAGEPARNLQQLCLFVVERIAQRDPQAALRVLRPLHEGFAGIVEEAVALEREGKIPEFGAQSAWAVDA